MSTVIDISPAAGSHDQSKYNSSSSSSSNNSNKNYSDVGFTDDIDIFRGLGPDRMFISYAVEVSNYNKVTMVDDLAMLAVKRLRQLGRLSKDARKVTIIINESYCM